MPLLESCSTVSGGHRFSREACGLIQLKHCFGEIGLKNYLKTKILDRLELIRYHVASCVLILVTSVTIL